MFCLLVSVTGKRAVHEEQQMRRRASNLHAVRSDYRTGESRGQPMLVKVIAHVFFVWGSLFVFVRKFAAYSLER